MICRLILLDLNQNNSNQLKFTKIEEQIYKFIRSILSLNN